MVRTCVWQRLVTLASILLTVSSAYGQAGDSSPALATITAHGARFVFPPEKSVWAYNPLTDSAKRVSSAYVAWRVNWIPPEGRLGADPDGLWLFHRWTEVPTEAIALSTVLRTARVGVTTWCITCAAPVTSVRYDSKIVASIEDARLVIAVNARTARRRLFPQRPDSVILTRTTARGDEERWTVAVRP